MAYYTDDSCFEILYGGKKYKDLEFVRIDEICRISYITFRNMITREMFTFELNKIISFQKRLYRFSRQVKNKKNLAESKQDSLY